MNVRILIAAGGTGGHIYPALAVADAIKKIRPDAVVEFVGTAHGLENKLVPAAGYKVHHLPVGRLNANVGLGERIRTLFQLPFAFIRSWRLLRRFSPGLVLGVGGHASGPLLLVASLLKYRTAIWEPNAMPGLANRWLSRFVDEAWVVFREAEKYLRTRQTHSAGMPVRSVIEHAGRAVQNSNQRFRVLVFGGSQGARGVNTAVAEMIKSGGDWLNDYHFVHQTGAADFARVTQLYGSDRERWPVEIHEYLYDMAEQYAKADLVICRSGTGTLSELAACGKPSILIPFPFASDDHQRKNAETFAQKGAAVVILQKDLTPERLRETISGLRSDASRLAMMAERAREFHQPAAAENLARQFLERVSAHAVS